MSRVTKAMKTPRRKRPWMRPRKRVTHVGAKTIIFDVGRLSIGAGYAMLRDFSIDYGTLYREVKMEMERRGVES